ncbi:S26 family signal peptidase [Kitasatospora aburaviensis]
MREFPLIVVVALLVALVMKTFLVQVFVIPSGSMEETIQIGDRVLVDKFTPGSVPSRSAATSWCSRTRAVGWSPITSRPRTGRCCAGPNRSSPSSGCCRPTASRI